MAAAFLVHDGSADRTLTAIKMIDAGSVDRTITQGRVIGPDGMDRVFWDPSGTVSFSVAVDNSVITGVDSLGGGSALTSTVTATASGGTGPYTYAWTTISHSNVTPPSITNPFAAATKFRQTNMAASSSDNAVFRVTATDSLSNTATANVTATWTEL